MGRWIDIIILQNWSFMQLFCILKQQNTIPGMMWTQIIFVLQHHLLLSCFCTLTEKRNFKLVRPVPKDLKDKPTCLKSRNWLNIYHRFVIWQAEKVTSWPDLAVLQVFTGGLSSYCLILMVVSFLQVDFNFRSRSFRPHLLFSIFSPTFQPFGFY